MKLYHATDEENLPSIAREGMRTGSYWTSLEKLATYYAGTVEDEDKVSAILVVDLADLEAAAKAGGVELEPDYPGIEEPITSVIGMSQQRVWEQWRNSMGWQGCLDLIGSLRCPVPVPAALLRLEKDDEERPLLESDSVAGDATRPVVR